MPHNLGHLKCIFDWALNNLAMARSLNRGGAAKYQTRMQKQIRLTANSRWKFLKLLQCKSHLIWAFCLTSKNYPFQPWKHKLAKWFTFCFPWFTFHEILLLSQWKWPWKKERWLFARQVLWKPGQPPEKGFTFVFPPLFSNSPLHSCSLQTSNNGNGLWERFLLAATERSSLRQKGMKK